MLSMCPNLRVLNLTYVMVGVPQMKFIVKHCQKIECLSLSCMTANCSESFMENQVFSKLHLRALRLANLSSKFRGTFLKKLSPELIEDISLYSCHGLDIKLITDVIF